MRSLQYRSTVGALSAVFRRSGIDVLFLKGIVLAHTTYPDPSLRPSSDIDVWVRPERFDDALTELLNDGFQYPARYPNGVPGPSPNVRVLERSGTSVMIEIHRTPGSLSDLSDHRRDEMWKRARPVRVGETTVKGLHPVDLLLHSSLHALKRHGLAGGLLEIIDIALIVEKFADLWDWHSMRTDYESSNVTIWMHVSLSLAARLLNAPVPPDFLAQRGMAAELEPIVTLSEKQLWGAERRLPTSLEQLNRPTSRGGHWSVLRDRLFWFYFVNDGDVPRTPLATLRDATRRLRVDLTVKAPKYFRLWRSGALRGETLTRQQELARQRGQISELVEQAQARLRSTGTLPECR